MHALVSIHDVMPDTLSRVRNLLEAMSHLPSNAVTLLVVPGLNWQPEQVQELKQLQASGYILAGHGWFHQTRDIKGLYHTLHSALISRQAAEHLSLSAQEIETLISDCHRWFLSHDLSAPDFYVPPAWAMGAISKNALAALPFRYFENTAGLFDSRTGRQINLPLAGFEADNLFRASSLTVWNALNKVSSSHKRPLRLSIHPYDPELRLKNALMRMLNTVTEAVDYRSVF